VLLPLIERVAQQKAEHIVTGNLGTYRDQAAAEQFVQANSSWLYQNDGKGRVVRDPATGQPLLSQDGVRFRDYVNQAIQMGIAKLEHQQQYALSMLERDRFATTQGAGATNQGIKQNFLQQAAQRTANHAGSTTTQNNPNAPAQNASLSLADRLRADLAAAGITDRDLAA
jgi:GDP-D-mannose dehydratase